MKHDEKVALSVEMASFLLSKDCAQPMKLPHYWNKTSKKDLNELLQGIYSCIDELDKKESSKD